MVGALRGIGYSIAPMIISLIGACGLRLLWIATIFQIPQFHNPLIIYLSYPITWIISLVALIICYMWLKRRLEQRTVFVRG